MARTIKQGRNAKGKVDPDAPFCTYYRREDKWARKLTNRRNRHVVNNMLPSVIDFDDAPVPVPPHTGGWISR